jgi:hypothetical protein
MTVYGQRTPAATRPYEHIKLYPVAERIGLPRTTRTLFTALTVTARLFGVTIPYRLYPNCIEEGGNARCVFYVAYNTRASRNEFVVGPARVDKFDADSAWYASAAGNFFGLTGFYTDYQLSSAVTVEHLLNGDLIDAAMSFGDSWAEALQDPSWWVQVAGATAAATTGRPMAASTAARVRTPTSFPAVARALRTQANLQGLNITRSVQLIEQPTVFRHTITGDVPAVNLARIQQEGSLRLSAGIRAHYGEGVYAWRANATGIGRRWIDIEVAPGTAAELIQTPAGTWYRLVPPDGDTLVVRVVGHNFTPEEVTLGRRVLAP